MPREFQAIARVWLRIIILLGMVGLFGCSDDVCDCEQGKGPHDELSPGDPVLLSPVNNASDPKDEDASILLAADGRFYVAWLSNRDGNDDLYLMHSEDGIQWSSPVRLTTNPASDWYPTLLQDSGGRFHLFWMRDGNGTRNVCYNSSVDGITWSEASELDVTLGVSDDFVPFAVEHGTQILVYFDSSIRSSDGTRSLFLVSSTSRLSNGYVVGWSAPIELDSANSETESDEFPYVGLRADGTTLLMTWIRHAGDPDDFFGFLLPSTDLFFATSTNGIDWSTPTAIMSEDGSVDTTPSFYLVGSDEVFTWMRGVNDSPHVMEIAFSDLDDYPNSAIDTTELNAVPGWSPRVVPTLKDNTFLRIWASGTQPQLYSQVFVR